MLNERPAYISQGETEIPDNTSVKSNTADTEAPASWNTKYTTPEGFICQINLGADSGKELLEKAQAAITHLLQAGCTPCDNISFRPCSNGNDNGSEAKANGNNGNGTGNNGNAHVCPIHGVEMKHWEKDGKVWFNHMVEGGWYTGKSK